MSGRELLTTVTLEVYYKYCKIYKFTLLSFDITTATMQKKTNEEISWNEGKHYIHGKTNEAIIQEKLQKIMT